MKKLTHYLSFLSVLIISACNNNPKTAGGEKITLQPNFKAGESYSVSSKVDMTQEVMGMNNIMNMGFVYKMDILGVAAEKDIEMKMLFDRITMSMKSPALAMSYDSDSTATAKPQDSGLITKDVQQGMSKVFGAMVGKSITVLLDAKGKVKEVRGYKELIQGVSDSAAGGMKDALSKSMNEDQIKQLFQQAFGMYPDKPVGVGDKWTANLVMTQNGIPMRTVTNYKVAEINPIENEVKLDLEGTVATEGDGTISQNGMSMKMKLDGKQTGQMIIDTKTGFVKTANIIQDMKATMEVMGQNMPMNMKSNISIFGKKL